VSKVRTLTVTAQIQTPFVPNFLRMTDGQMLPLSAVGDAGLRRIGKAWTEELIRRAAEQRKDATP
jgi:hypothetical protein